MTVYLVSACSTALLIAFVGTFTVAGAFAQSPRISEDQQDDTSIERFLEAWKFQDELLASISTLRIECVASKRTASKSVSEREFRQLWDDGKFSSREALDTTVKQLDASLKQNELGFVDKRFATSKNRWREEVHHNGTNWSTLRAANLEIRFQGHNNQIDVFRESDSQIHTDTLHNYRFVPRTTRSWDAYTLELLNNGRTSLESRDGNQKTVVDNRTLMVVESRSEQRLGDRSVVKLVLQSSSLNPSANVFFPRVLAIATFTNGHLAVFDVRIVQLLELDCPVAEEDFIMPVKAGVTLVDYRIDKRKPEVLIVERDVKDLFYLIAY